MEPDFDLEPGDRPAEEFENGGVKPLHVPGIGCHVNYELPRENRFGHGLNDWVQNPRLTAREIAMLQVMDALTDKKDWTLKILNEEIVDKWRAEALNMPLINEPTWDWILTELRDKAAFFKQHGFVLTYDTGSRCAKSDTLIGSELQLELQRSTQSLLRKKDKDWHPGSNEQVLNLVHPSLFPLVYGTSRILSTGQVGLHDCVESCGKGDVAPTPKRIEYRNHRRASQAQSSVKFQWLPCEVKFCGSQGTDVRISSYINNLHPVHHRDLYITIEKVLSKTIPLWNEVVIGCRDSFNDGRTPPRITLQSAEMDPPEPYELYRSLVTDPAKEGYQETVNRVKEYLTRPDNPDPMSSTSSWDDETKFLDGSWEHESNRRDFYGAVEWKWNRMRKTIHPNPGVACTYDQWKAGSKGERLDGKSTKTWVYSPFCAGDGYWGTPEFSHEYYSVKLEDEYREKGLQVIVKVASVELSPEKPTYAGGSWHLEGMLNEHIVATSIYYYDVKNTTEAKIRFRQEAELCNYSLSYAQDDHEPLAEIFGCERLQDEPAVQELGCISTPEGRLLVFPNTLHHCVQPFQLEDSSRPGHRRFLVLWLVDPNYRIASTANVPPQQYDWWEPHTLRRVLLRAGLPNELKNAIQEYTEHKPGGPLSIDEAKELRLELMKERTNLMPAVEGDFGGYNFCEH